MLAEQQTPTAAAAAAGVTTSISAFEKANYSSKRQTYKAKDETCLTFAYESATATTTTTADNNSFNNNKQCNNKNNSMTKQLTTTTATNAAANITNNTNLAPKVISPITTPTTTATTTTDSGGSGSGNGSGGSSSSGVGTATTTTPQSAATSPTPMPIILPTPTTTATTTVVRHKLTPADATTATTTTTTTTAAAAAATTTCAITPTSTSTTTATATTNAANDASGRSAALERAYVHDVYEHCEEPTGPIRPRVAQFLGNLDPGSVVCDVGCGSGRYLTQCNPAICTVGVDRCYRLSKVAREKGGEVALCDNLELPFRDECFDAVLSLAVVHHFATTERRVSALRELARILRIGGRVVITVWALEQRHRRFESQDVLIPWQPPKNRNFSYSDEEDDDDFLPPYHAYTEDSTNSSRSAGDGDSSSLSSSSPGESCYSFVRRAIQKLAGGRRHAWFLDSWTSKDTKNDSSLDYEDAKDLPIELRRLEDFEDFSDPPLSAGLKSRSLGSILQPPPRQIVRSRSSVPSLGGPLLGGILHNESLSNKSAQFLSAYDATQQQPNSAGGNGAAGSGAISNGHSPTHGAAATVSGGGGSGGGTSGSNSLGRRPKLIKQKQSLCDEDYQLPEQPFHMVSNYNTSNNSVSSTLYTKSGCYPSALNYHQHASSGVSGGDANDGGSGGGGGVGAASGTGNTKMRKQSSLNEELMAGNRLREKERVRKRIQKQTSLNEAFLCRSAMLSKRLQVIREGFTSKIKSSTGSLERVTKTGLVKIMQNLKTSATGEATAAGMRAQNGSSVGGSAVAGSTTTGGQPAGKAVLLSQHSHGSHHHHHHHHHHHIQQQQQQQQQPTAKPNGVLQTHFSHLLHKQNSTTTSTATAAVAAVATAVGGTAATATKFSGGPVTYCNSSECSGPNVCYCSAYHQECSVCAANPESEESKARRHSRESGSDSSKDSSLQSDTSIESEDSFASVIFIPKPEQHQQQLNYQQQHQNSNSSSSNSSSSNGAANPCCQATGKCGLGVHCATMCQQSTHAQHNQPAQQQQHQHQHNTNNSQQRIPSVPTSPLIMPCPPTPAHSPAATQTAVTSPPQTMAAVTGAMAILTPPMKPATAPELGQPKPGNTNAAINMNGSNKNRFNFDEAHIKEQATQDQLQANVKSQPATLPAANKATLPIGEPTVNKITRQSIKDLPPIPKFRKQQSLQLQRQSFPIIRRASGSNSAGLPSIPKLLSLELFNPATDDLDSDSSEPSSPDSIDSVISAPKSANLTTASGSSNTQDASKVESATEDEGAEPTELIKTNQAPYYNGDMKINSASSKDMILNDDSSNLLPTKPSNGGLGNGAIPKKPQDCAEFAEQLSAQLQRELDDKQNPVECRSLDGIGDISEFLDDALGTGGSNGSGTGSLKKRSGAEARDLTAIREELRERRLMLANLSTQPSLQQSPTSSSTSSLSSQTRSFTIHEEDEEEEDEDENERSYTLQLYENCKISKFNYKRNRHYNLNPETAYLLQDDGDSSSVRDEDEMNDENEHNVIPEEDEDAEALEAKSGDQLGEGMHDYARKSSRNTIKCDSFEEDDNESATKSLLGKEATTTGGAAANTKHHTHQQQQQQQQQQQPLQNRHSTESWEHSNSSTTSLDSPSQGGATTHHRYYHVFREGELDALINHHVASLHIVSSYYERASWCVVAEKVQVWTI